MDWQSVLEKGLTGILAAAMIMGAVLLYRNFMKIINWLTPREDEIDENEADKTDTK